MGILIDKRCSWFWNDLNLHVRRTCRGYFDHTELSESKNYLQVEQLPSELFSALCDVNETPLSCLIEQCGKHTCY